MEEAQNEHIQQYGDLEGFASKSIDEMNTRVALYDQSFSDRNYWAANKNQGVRRIYPEYPLGNDNVSVVACIVQGNVKGGVIEYPIEEEFYSTSNTIYNLPFKHNTMFAATRIDGDVYFAGAPRKLFKRIGPEKWIDLTDEHAHPLLQADVKWAIEQTGDTFGMPLGFDAFDGFHANDIYAGGFRGDCWHFNGETWRAMDLPANFDITAIVCAPDGFVYIACDRGQLIKGRYQDGNERWKLIENPIAHTINEMAWFQCVLYLATEEGLYTCIKDEVARYAFPKDGAAQFSFFGVKSCEEALLSYGPDQALTFDGKQWEHVIGNPSVHVPSIEDLLPDA